MADKEIPKTAKDNAKDTAAWIKWAKDNPKQAAVMIKDWIGNEEGG